MAPSILASLFAVALSQVAPGAPTRGGDAARPTDPAGPVDGVGVAPSPAATPDPSEPEVPSGIPFLPTVGVARRPSDGLHLDAGLASQLRTRTLFTNGEASWATDLELTPGIALEVGSTNFVLSVGYAPRFTIPFGVEEFELAVLNRATANVEWRLDPLWTVTGLGVFVFGDYSQLNPASTPAGPGPPPPVLNPIRSFQTYPYVGIDTLLRVDATVSPRTRLRLAGGYFDVGGVGEVGQQNQPRAWGPQGEVSFAWDASRRATLTTSVNAQNWMMSGDETFLIATVTEAWRQRWTNEFETTVSLGGGYSNREVETTTAAGKVVPVGRLAFAYRSESRQPVAVSLDVGLTPYFDTYDRQPYQRFTLGATVDWHPSDAWRVGASLAGALAPYTVRAPESYGTAGVSASYSPISILVLTVGGFSQSQFQGAEDGGGAFRQWTTYLSVTLWDRFQL